MGQNGIRAYRISPSEVLAIAVTGMRNPHTITMAFPQLLLAAIGWGGPDERAPIGIMTGEGSAIMPSLRGTLILWAKDGWKRK